MNLLKNLSRTLILGLLVISVACNKDEEPTLAAPVITFSSPSSNPYTATAGDAEVPLIVNVTAEGVFNTIQVLFKIDGTTFDDLTFNDTKEPGATATTYTYQEVSLGFEEDNVGQTITVEVTVTDDLNQTSTATLTIMVESAPVNAYSATLLYAPTADDSGTAADERTSLTWFSTNLGETISSAAIVASTSSSSDVDFGYYYGNTDNASIAAPASYPSSIYDLSSTGQQWGTMNSTMFKTSTMTNEQFLALSTTADVMAAYEASSATASGSVTGLSVGDVVLFQTDGSKVGGSKVGAFYVTSISGTWNENDNIQLEILAQP